MSFIKGLIDSLGSAFSSSYDSHPNPNPNPNPNSSSSMDGGGGAPSEVSNERLAYMLKGYFDLAKGEIDKAVRAEEWGLVYDAIVLYNSAQRILAETSSSPVPSYISPSEREKVKSHRQKISKWQQILSRRTGHIKMAEHMRSYDMPDEESSPLRCRVPNRDARRVLGKTRSFYILVSYELIKSSHLFVVDLDDRFRIWPRHISCAEGRRPFRLLPLQGLWEGEFYNRNSMISCLFGIHHSNQLYILPTAVSKSEFMGTSMSIDSMSIDEDGGASMGADEDSYEGYIYRIPSETEIAERFCEHLQLCKSFKGPKANKAVATVISAYEKIYVLLNPYWYVDGAADTFEVYDPVSSTWQSLPPLGKSWGDDSWISGYLVSHGFIIVCLRTNTCFEAKLAAYNIYAGCWVKVMKSGSIPCWEKKALTVDGIVYAITVEGEIIAFSVDARHIGGQVAMFSINMLKLVHGDFFIYDYRHSQCLSYVGNKAFCLVQSAYNELEDTNPDGKQPLFITTLCVEGNKVIVLDSKVYDVHLERHENFLLDICFTPGCEAIDSKAEDLVFSKDNWMVFNIIEPNVGDTSENTNGGETINIAGLPLKDNEMEESADEATADYGDDELTADHELTADYGGYEPSADEHLKGWSWWSSRMAKGVIPLIVIGLTWLQSSKRKENQI